MNVLLAVLGSLQITSGGDARAVVRALPSDSVAAPLVVAPVFVAPVFVAPVFVAPLFVAPTAVALTTDRDTLDPADTLHRRPRAIEYSDAYYKRLTIHRIGSYTMLPLFAGEYVLGQRLLTGTYPPRWMKPAHGAVAGALGVLFTVNTVTGAWNLWDARHDDNERMRRYLHTGLMLASDAGFAWAGAIGGESNESLGAAHLHRNVAIGSMALSTAGTLMMWLWKN